MISEERLLDEDDREEEEEDREDEEEEEEEGEDIMANAELDYAAIPELDQYDETMLSREQIDPMDIETRLAAEAEIAARSGLDVDRYLADDSGISGLEGLRRRKEELAEEEEDEEAPVVNIEAVGRSEPKLREWIAQEGTRSEIKRRFRYFLVKYETPEKEKVYISQIRSMCAKNGTSLIVKYPELAEFAPVLAVWCVDAPRDLLEIFDEVATEVTLEFFPEYKGIVSSEIRVRVADFAVKDSLQFLRKAHRNKLVRVTGVVTRRSGVFSQLKVVSYQCPSCKAIIGPFGVSSGNNHAQKASSMCPVCEYVGQLSLSQQHTVYRNYQRISLQEAPGSVAPGHIPRTKEIILLNDMVDIVRPGEEVDVTGIFGHSYQVSNQGGGYPVYSTTIEANYVIALNANEKSDALLMTQHEKNQLFQIAKRDDAIDLLLSAMAPSIHGHRFVKQALLLALMGGCAKDVQGKHRIRGDVNVLLLGDPGCAKSQLLKYCCSLIPRAVYATGKGASAVGLTAGVHRDSITREWTLEGGALVLADNGICAIDEFDKMNEQDRTSIHEAMEQQSISISKAGIVTSLRARCSVIAAANPIGGQYDSSLTFTDNVELTDPIIQRFDILCVLQDTIDPVRDADLAESVVMSHQRAYDTSLSSLNETNTPKTTDQPISQATLRRYIAYARANCFPTLSAIDQDKVSKLYSELRLESIACGGIPIAVRHLESLMRIAEAHAKIGLRDHVSSEDLDAAIAVVVHSFISAQKFSVRSALEKGFKRYYLSAQRADRAAILLYALRALLLDAHTYQPLVIKQSSSAKNDEFAFSFDDILDKLAEYGPESEERTLVKDLKYSQAALLKHGFEFDLGQRLVVWTPPPDA